MHQDIKKYISTLKYLIPFNVSIFLLKYFYSILPKRRMNTFIVTNQTTLFTKQQIMHHRWGGGGKK